MTLIYSMIAGVAVFILSFHYMERFLDWLRFQSIGTRDYVLEKCNLMFIETTANQVLFWMILGSAGPFVIIFLAFLPKVVPGIVFGLLAAVVGWKAPKPVIDFIYERRVQKFNLQMVDGLALMANAMKSGLSVVQGLGIVAEQMPNPMSQEFKLVLSENQVGVSVEDAFSGLAKRIKSEDVDMFVTSINILKETGGNLAETFDTIVYVIRERLKVENKIKALTMQGYIQGMILLAIPPVLGIYFAISEEGFLDPVFSSILGWIMLAVIFLLEFLAYFMIKKVVTVDV